MREHRERVWGSNVRLVEDTKKYRAFGTSFFGSPNTLPRLKAGVAHSRMTDPKLVVCEISSQARRRERNLAPVRCDLGARLREHDGSKQMHLGMSPLWR